MQSAANQSPHQIPCYYNRENNREFCKIRTSNTIFVSDQRADSTAYSQIPYAKEQGIFKYVSGNFFRGTGKFNQAAEEQEISIGIARSGVTKRSRRCEQDRRAPLVDRPLQVFGGDAADDPRPIPKRLCGVFKRERLCDD